MADQWDALTALADPGRRALFEYIQRARHPVSREEAADALGISRNLAAFHLDKLAEAGLLQTRYEAPADQPRGRGRTPKVYEPVTDTVSVSLPPREYQLVAQILADAVASDPANAASAARRAAYRHGLQHGDGQRAAGKDLAGALAAAGYLPEPQAERIVLTNCPFHALAASQTELTCAINLDYVSGLIDGVRARECHAHLTPSPGRCCVEITTTDP